MLAPRSRFWVDVEAMLCHVGGKMATKSAKMSQHRRQGANPRGFEVSAGTQDGRHHLSLYSSGAFGLVGGRAESFSFSYSRIKVLRFKGLKD